MSISTQWAVQLSRAVAEIEEEDYKWQQEFFWRQSYNSVVSAPRKHYSLPKSRFKSERSMHFSPERQVFQSTISSNNRIPVKDNALRDAAELIENQIKEITHPLNKVLKLFNKYFGDYYLEYCCSATAYYNKETRSYQVSSGFSQCEPEMFEGVAKQSTMQLRQFVRIFYLTIIRYYRVNINLTRSKEIILDKMTQTILRDKVYAVVMLLLMKKNEKKIEKLAGLMQKFKDITLAELTVSKYFQFDETFRSSFKPIDGGTLISDLETTRAGETVLGQQRPFMQAIRDLENIRGISEPTGKLNHIYNLNKTIIAEIDRFWSGHLIHSSKLAIDTDNLLGVYIYVIIKSQFPQLIVEIEIANEFLTDRAKLSNRGFFLATLQTSVEYIMNYLESDFEKQKVETYVQEETLSDDTIQFSKVLEKECRLDKTETFISKRQRLCSNMSGEEDKEEISVTPRVSSVRHHSRTFNQVELGANVVQQKRTFAFYEDSENPLEIDEGRATTIKLSRVMTKKLQNSIIESIEHSGFRESILKPEESAQRGTFVLEEVNEYQA